MQPWTTHCRAAALALVVFVPPFARAAEAAAPEKVSYYKQVRPIFQAHCQGCHQPAKARGEYVMTDFARLLAGGDSGDKAVVPHQPDDSRLVADVTPAPGGQAKMPPDGKNPLSADEVALVRRWVAEGAADDTPA